MKNKLASPDDAEEPVGYDVITLRTVTVTNAQLNTRVIVKFNKTLNDPTQVDEAFIGLKTHEEVTHTGDYFLAVTSTTVEFPIRYLQNIFGLF